ncbi:hypothetical protein CPT_Phriendly_008 [Vibrio phage Phriendly]|nr:hypothetical protein CPT_Phriendly_008 [Vibrio phage Phriendly]
MERNITLKELGERCLIKQAIDTIKKHYLAAFKDLVVSDIKQSAQFPNSYEVKYQVAGKEGSHIVLISMKDSLEMLLNGMNNAVETLK